MENIIRQFGLNPPFEIVEINKSAKLINEKFVLKENEDSNQVEKTLKLNSRLTANGIPVTEYLSAVSGDKFVVSNDKIFTLMRKMKGEHIDPFKSDYISIAINTGVEVARLHKVLKNISDIEAKKSDFINELNGWIIPNAKGIPQEIFDSCLQFENHYRELPRQLIHRDIHFQNILFKNSKVSGFLDFDISQENVRIFDISYLFSSMLVGKYHDADYVKKWHEFACAFLGGYNSENTLQENELNAIYKIILSIQLIFAAYYKSINQDELIPDCIEMAKWVYANEKELTIK
ncbi:MAG: phosphotransferase [Clostridiales bacterium]|nr:phosphotransferase [Clostridiales bacterium]